MGTQTMKAEASPPPSPTLCLKDTDVCCTMRTIFLGNHVELGDWTQQTDRLARELNCVNQLYHDEKWPRWGTEMTEADLIRRFQIENALKLVLSRVNVPIFATMRILGYNQILGKNPAEAYRLAKQAAQRVRVIQKGQQTAEEVDKMIYEWKFGRPENYPAGISYDLARHWLEKMLRKRAALGDEDCRDMVETLALKRETAGACDKNETTETKDDDSSSSPIIEDSVTRDHQSNKPTATGSSSGDETANTHKEAEKGSSPANSLVVEDISDQERQSKKRKPDQSKLARNPRKDGKATTDLTIRNEDSQSKKRKSVTLSNAPDTGVEPTSQVVDDRGKEDHPNKKRKPDTPSCGPTEDQSRETELTPKSPVVKRETDKPALAINIPRKTFSMKRSGRVLSASLLTPGQVKPEPRDAERPKTPQT